MMALLALAGVAILCGLAFLGSGASGGAFFFGVVFPYAAITLFLVGFVYKVLRWARAPVPFRIPTTCGQEKSLPWIKNQPLDNPHSKLTVLGRMALEVLCFRSLFRNTRSRLTASKLMAHESSKPLWLAAMAFHWCFLVLVLRHLRFFLEPVPFVLGWIEQLDGMFQLTSPTFFLTDAIVVGAIVFLLGRRVWISQLRYFSLPADYFALFLLLAVMVSGIFMRYVTKTDIASVKELTMGLVAFQPVVPAGLGPVFFMHLFVVSVLFAYFPFSKLMHMPGVFMSPTRNLANDNRARRHVNPWNPTAEEVGAHTYEEWEEEFKDKLVASGYRLEGGEQ